MPCPTFVRLHDSSETVLYEFKEYPLYLQYGILSQYPDYSAISHWHEDFEFIVILSGHMTYQVNGALYQLEKGQGIFVNSRQLHHGYSEDFTECEFLCILFPPALLHLNDYFLDAYVTPIVTNGSCPCQHFTDEKQWQKQLLEYLVLLYEKRGTELAPLEIQPLVWNIWNLLFLHLPKPEHRDRLPARQLSAIREMIAFIQQNYMDTITLDQIADAGHLCKSSCLILFKKYLSQSPIRYLTDYRLKKALALLQNTDHTITEISYQVGFNHPSYFTETFKKYYQCTPREYAVLFGKQTKY